MGEHAFQLDPVQGREQPPGDDQGGLFGVASHREGVGGVTVGHVQPGPGQPGGLAQAIDQVVVAGPAAGVGLLRAGVAQGGALPQPGGEGDDQHGQAEPGPQAAHPEPEGQGDQQAEEGQAGDHDGHRDLVGAPVGGDLLPQEVQGAQGRRTMPTQVPKTTEATSRATGVSPP